MVVGFRDAPRTAWIPSETTKGHKWMNYELKTRKEELHVNSPVPQSCRLMRLYSTHWSQGKQTFHRHWTTKTTTDHGQEVSQAALRAVAKDRLFQAVNPVPTLGQHTHVQYQVSPHSKFSSWVVQYQTDYLTTWAGKSVKTATNC